MINILIEENYARNNRVGNVLTGVNSVSRKKRIGIHQTTRVEDIEKGARVVILISGSLKWAMETVNRLNRLGIHPIVFGFHHIETMYSYSSITQSYTKSMRILSNYLLEKNHKDIVFLGYNPDSLPDYLKLTGVRYAAAQHGVSCEMFENRGNAIACLDKFSKNCENVGNIVCANDGIAIILRSLYPELLEGRLMCSCAAMRMSEFYKYPHPTAVVNYFKAGELLVELYLFLMKCEEIPATVVQLDMDLYLETGDKLETPFGLGVPIDNAFVDFYGDEAISEVENIERMLLSCDKTDLAILKQIMHNVPYEEIAEIEHLALNTVKYRIHAMLKNARLDSRKKLLAVIEKFGLIFE